jgi:Fic family protein
MTSENFPKETGLLFIIKNLDLNVPPPAVRSKIVSGARRTVAEDDIVYEYYPKSYAPQEGLYGHIKFALRYEPVDPGVYRALFGKLGAGWFEEQIKTEPTGIYARRLWYLYESLTGRKLNLKEVPATRYVDLLDNKLQFTGTVRKVSRQRINDNLYGTGDYCLLIRRTEKLKRLREIDLTERTAGLFKGTDPHLLARAVQFLYTKETKSSFAIEGERVSKRRGERFVSALRRSADFDIASKMDYIELQNLIVDPRYREEDWRQVQNFVGQTMSDFREHVYFVSPKPEDVAGLMENWMDFIERVGGKDSDAVGLAAAASFGFVFIHPFEDGNGRIHRFLIHHFLSGGGFTPEGVIFPVSAVMLRHRRRYDKILESYSSAIMPFIDYAVDRSGGLTVKNDTADLYRYWDATRFVEYLYECVIETIDTDLKEEIGFLKIFDRALEAVSEIVEMPDARAALLVKLIMQNKGRLSKRKRDKFSELIREEINEIEDAIRQIIGS